MSSLLDPWLSAAAVVFILVTLLWLVSLRIRDVSIIDSFWSLGFVVSAWIYRSQGGEASPAQWLHLGLVTLWGVRLAAHIAWRHAKHGEEDPRYQAMRRRTGDAFRWTSLVKVFWLQAALICVIAAPLLWTQAGTRVNGGALAPWVWTDALAVVLFAIGFAFEAGGDWQLTKFRDDPSNRGKVLRTGFWAWTRHPNYFGDAVIWWSFGVAALGSVGGVYTLPASILMTFLLLKVSGVALLEKDIAERRPKYRDYIESTPAFFPRPPSRR
ncbi:MAG: DUF1295 domain-containing protein [Acidobacteriota bacterium]